MNSISCVNATCLGARHRKLGDPCQDFSASHIGVLSDGTPFGLLVVADGHGHPRHCRSATGASLATQLTLRLVIAHLTKSGTLIDSCPTWFQHNFPNSLLAEWRRAVSEDALLNFEEHDPDLIAYGTTLGLALLTPHWWLSAGLGDWDLVLLADEMVQIVNEENSTLESGESTFSLCHHDPLPAIAERFTIGKLEGSRVDLVLCTDGIRKSCRNDNDFGSLCRYIALQGVDEGSLQRTLLKITTLGSGDDVSVAVSTLRCS